MTRRRRDLNRTRAALAVPPRGILAWVRTDDARKIWETWERIAAITETASSADGSVTAAVNVRGQLQGLTLDQRVYRRPDAVALANSIVATIAEASRLAQRRAFHEMTPLLPVGATFAETDLAIAPIIHHIANERS